MLKSWRSWAAEGEHSRAVESSDFRGLLSRLHDGPQPQPQVQATYLSAAWQANHDDDLLGALDAVDGLWNARTAEVQLSRRAATFILAGVGL
eukprot:364213-Chlamydomonas_euryale.AAC.11